MGNEEINPWETLLRSEHTSEIAKGITEAWTELRNEVTTLQHEIEETGEEPPNIQLMNNSVESAGFTNKNKIPHYSLTKQITIEMESARYKVLEQKMLKGEEANATYQIKQRERESFLEADALSTQFLTALPDVLGIQHDKIITETVHTYLGQPSPCMRPYMHTPH